MILSGGVLLQFGGCIEEILTDTFFLLGPLFL